jgi:hypothetical protein
LADKRREGDRMGTPKKHHVVPHLSFDLGASD